MNSSDDLLLRTIRESSAQILETILPTGADVALLDFPDHMNVGDTMIWVGELAYLRRGRHRIRYVCDINRFSEKLLRKRLPTGPILLHGGGNFGDVWPNFQRFREEVVSTFPDRQIVQLSQTIMFTSAEAAARANSVLGSHPDYTLLVRDAESLARAKSQLPDVKVIFCPDMALGWSPNPVAPAKSKIGPLLVLARRDREANSNLADATTKIMIDGDTVTDWGLKGLERRIWKLVRVPARLARVVPGLKDSPIIYPLVAAGYRTMTLLNVRAGLRTFRSASVVVTDRLHAHVLAGLLGIPHVVMDNNYGKIKGVLDASTGQLSTVTFARTTDDATSAVAKMRLVPDTEARDESGQV